MSGGTSGHERARGQALSRRFISFLATTRRGIASFLHWWSAERILAFVGVAVGVISILAALSTAKTRDEVINISLVALVTAVLVLSGTVLLLIWKLWGDHSVSDSEMRDIANQFATLVARESRYQAAVAISIKRIFENKDDTKEWQEVQNLLDDFVQALCNTAAYILTKKKGDYRDVVSANIKYFDEAEDGSRDVVHVVWRRSDHSDQARDEADEETRKKEFRVVRNMMYDTLLGSESHCIIPNLRKYLDQKDEINRHRNDDDKPAYREPSEKALRFYNSCLAVPIKSGAEEIFPDPDDPDADIVLQSQKQGPILGIFCVDSKRYSYFDETYDLHILNQLAEHACNAFRASFALKLLRKMKERGRARRK